MLSAETDINKIVKAVKIMESLCPVVTHAMAKEVELKLDEMYHICFTTDHCSNRFPVLNVTNLFCIYLQ